MHCILFVSMLVYVALQTCFHVSRSVDPCAIDTDCPGVECFKYNCKTGSSASDDNMCVAEPLVAGNCSEHQMYCLDQITCATACDNITECPGGEDERNCTQPCACEDIYEFILPCTKYTDRWVELEGKVIAGNNIGTQITVSSPEECQQHCLSTTGCRSCEIGITSGTCWLNTKTVQEALLADVFVNNAYYNLYLRVCAEC